MDINKIQRKESMISEYQSSQLDTQDLSDLNTKLNYSQLGHYSSYSNSNTNSPCILPIKRRGRPKKIKTLEELSLENTQKKKNSMDESYIQYYIENEKKNPEQMKLLVKKRIQVCQNLKKKKWDKEEEQLLYSGLKQHGSDFQLLAAWIKTKSYKQVKEKFNKEIKKGNIEIEQSLLLFQENKKIKNKQELEQKIQQEQQNLNENKQQQEQDNKIRQKQNKQDIIMPNLQKQQNSDMEIIKPISEQQIKSKYTKKREIIIETNEQFYSQQNSPLKYY